MFKRMIAAASLAALLTPAWAITTGEVAITTGDMAFTALTAFNADEDGWSMVMLADIAAGTTALFSDGTASSATAIGGGGGGGGGVGVGESSFSWLTAAGKIQAGTVVGIASLDTAGGTAGPTVGRTASVGSLFAVNNNNIGLSATAETAYAFLGTSDSTGSAVTTMLTAVCTKANNSALTTVGLATGTYAIKLTSSADFAGHIGPRNNESVFSASASLVNNPGNWSINVDGDGSAMTPDTSNQQPETSPWPSPRPTS